MSLNHYVDAGNHYEGEAPRRRFGLGLGLWVVIAALGAALFQSQRARLEAGAELGRAEAKVRTMAEGKAINAVWHEDRDNDGEIDPARAAWARLDGRPRPGVYRYIVIVDTTTAGPTPD